MCLVCLFQAPLSNIAEVQNSIMDELNNLSFVKDNAQKLMERKVSFERQRDKKIAVRKVVAILKEYSCLETKMCIVTSSR